MVGKLFAPHGTYVSVLINVLRKPKPDKFLEKMLDPDKKNTNQKKNTINVYCEKCVHFHDF